MTSSTTAQPRKSFEEHLLDHHHYRKASSDLRRPFKHYQLAQLKLLARWVQDHDASIAYGAMYLKMRRFLVVPYILARPESFEVFIFGRLWLLTKQLRKAGFQYNPTAKCWRYKFVK